LDRKSLDPLCTVSRQQILDGEIHTDNKNHDRHIEESKHSPTLPINYNNFRSSEPGRHHSPQWNDEWGLASKIELAMAQDPVPTQTILGTISKMHPSNILHMHPSNILHTILTIATFPFQCQPRQAAWGLAPGPQKHMVPMLPQANRRHNNNKIIAI
jgi:hypothetical protein